MEFLDEFFCGVWYWYTSIKFSTIYKLLLFGWNSIQNIFKYILNNNFFLKKEKSLP
jgi:hypothetical protein